MPSEKVALVVGAGKGSGRRAAEALAQRGWQLAVSDLTPVNLDETVARLQALGARVRPYLADIAKKLPVQGLLNQVLDDFGRLDLVVNCAEVEPQKSVLEMDEWDWARTLDVNLTAAFLLTQSASRIMKTQGGGLILHIGSRPKGQARRAAYLASKAALATFVQIAAKELVEFGIQVELDDSLEHALERLRL
ncbi:MAG: SDR family oxidoreductase [Anaerolineales bacterium]|nr:SDR family oxidoreductase [Anaerolineales bacterium]